MRIILIRHGETTGDVEDRYGGDYDDNLSDNGYKKSKKLKDKLKDKNIKTILSSSLIRAKQTSQIINEHAKCGIVINHDLRSRNKFGVLSGMIRSEAKLKHPELVELLKDKMNTIEGAEPYNDFNKRVINAFDEVINNNTHECIAIVTHDGVIKILFSYIFKCKRLDDLEDCAYIELEKKDDEFILIGNNCCD